MEDILCKLQLIKALNDAVIIISRNTDVDSYRTNQTIETLLNHANLEVIPAIINTLIVKNNDEIKVIN